MGVIATSVALNLAKEANLDLVEVAPNAKPPVAKLIDYGKFKYNEKIKAREARRNQSTAEIKEIRFRLKIDDHDFDVKKGHVTRFLNGGDKVKVTQGAGSAVLAAGIDARLPANAVRVSSSHPATATLGAMFGAIQVEKAGEGN